MKEIKFRQYIKGIWHFWGFLENGVFIGPANNTSSEEQQEESQQFTGLKDKNGKEIYEGDIMSSEMGNGRITWVECSGKFVLEGDNFLINPWDGYEVIGNIFENKDLLNK